MQLTRVGLLALATGVVATTGSAQYLRSGAIAQATGAGSDSRESDWHLASAPGVSGQSASASGFSNSATASFTAGFGLLRGKATAQVSGGTGNASGGGTFASFTNFVGAGFNDRITLAGPGAVTLRVLYSLHSIGSISGEGASTQGGLDVFAFNTGGGPVLTGGRVWHLTPGENTTTLGFDITGTAGDQFTLQGELSIFAGVVRTSVGSSSASLDADHTGLVSIEALSGSFASASGADYAPVPEPGSLLVLGLGALAVRRRRN